MENKTVQELRDLARAQGIKGYSRMRKGELLEALKSAAPGGPRTTAPRKPPAEVPAPAHDADAEEQAIERAKYVLAPEPAAEAPPEPADDLHEPIDALPPLPAPVLQLLPQKPGVLHAYWSLAPEDAGRAGLMLRLCQVSPRAARILVEVPLPADSGHWYFHIDPGLPATEVYLQLGHYDPEGRFVTAMDHGIVRVPRLYAAARTDRHWWISDREFERLYLRAGGLKQGDRLGWPGGTSSG